ncbi:hypothetical protein A3Q56_00175 [Intoshia linei]|uniref:WW domain-containing protein n=1 Tax=Intoshia linei TaxID=1819745 RepID=A0A177BES7_9BILA|nr:hypothetical protein A3Q56_00175 [Intoshia linei]
MIMLKENHSDKLKEKLPDGWEAAIHKESNRIYYIDHKNKTTTWDNPNVTMKPLSIVPVDTTENEFIKIRRRLEAFEKSLKNYIDQDKKINVTGIDEGLTKLLCDIDQIKVEINSENHIKRKQLVKDTLEVCKNFEDLKSASENNTNQEMQE